LPRPKRILLYSKLEILKGKSKEKRELLNKGRKKENFGEKKC
jgi:hypothetical protein